MKKINKTLRKKLIFLISSVIFAIALYFGANMYNRYLEQQKQAEARNIYDDAVDKYETPSPPPSVIPSVSQSAIPSVTETPAASPTVSPLKDGEIRPEFLELREHYENDDIIGYLRIDGTTIDYPVTQYSDNSYYLSHDVYKKHSIAGWPFLDYECDVAKEDKNMIIYGHNMNNDYMFHSLRFFADEEYFKEHKYITFNTVYDTYTWEIFSFFRTMTSFNYIQVIFEDDDEFGTLVAEIKAKSMYDTGVEVDETDRILNLSTCTNAHEDERFVLSARLIKHETKE